MGGDHVGEKRRKDEYHHDYRTYGTQGIAPGVKPQLVPAGSDMGPGIRQFGRMVVISHDGGPPA
jgi:hypothetical protein